MTAFTSYQNASLLILRCTVGAVFMWAGLAKWFVWSAPLPGMSTSMINLTKLLSIVEPLGALALLLGFLTRWAASGLAIIMLGSLYFVYFMFQAGIFTSEKGTGMDYNLLLLAGSLVLAAFGAGRWSLDARRTTSLAQPEGRGRS
jgi:putative oxidoreductase